MRELGTLLVGINILVGFLTRIDGCFESGDKGHKMRDCPKIKARCKEFNQASLDPNAPKKNPPYGMRATKVN